MKKNQLTIALLMFGSTLSSAIQFSDLLVVAGSGSKQAVLVIDFNDGQTPKSYAWGFRWEGTATGEDMLAAIDALDPLLSTSRGTFSGFGAFLSRVQYLPVAGGFRHDQTGSGNAFWSYWNRTASSNWTFASSGMTSRILSDGDRDGWSFTPDFNLGSQPPTEPVAAVPEPASLLSLGLGLLALRRQRGASRR